MYCTYGRRYVKQTRLCKKKKKKKKKNACSTEFYTVYPTRVELSQYSYSRTNCDMPVRPLDAQTSHPPETGLAVVV